MNNWHTIFLPLLPKMHMIYYIWLAMVIYAIGYLLVAFIKPPKQDK